MNFYSLLFISDGEKHANLKTKSDPIEIYLRCGALLQYSMSNFGLRHAIITNNVQKAEEIADRIGVSVALKSFGFSREVPNGIGFRAAHNKLDIIRAFGTGEFGSFVGLLDLDMVMLNPFDLRYETCGTLLGYNITDQIVGAYGDEAVLSSFRKIGVVSPDRTVNWWGGEFIAGSADSFRDLSSAVDEIYCAYTDNAKTLFHQGDEMVVSAALALMTLRSKTAIILDPECVSRWWSARTLSNGMPLKNALKYPFIHLPADKEILASLQGERVSHEQIALVLQKRLKAKTRKSRLLNYIVNVLRGESKVAPKL